MPSDADKAWEQMLGNKPAPSPSAPAVKTTVDSTTPQRAAPAPSPAPIAAAPKWAAIALLGVVAIVAIVWVVLSNRTQPAIVKAPSAPQGTIQPGDTPPAQPAAAGSLLDLNTATAAQFEHLPGIGPALASRIVADRSKNGRFASVDQLDRVEGIGKKTIDKLRPYLTVK